MRPHALLLLGILGVTACARTSGLQHGTMGVRSFRSVAARDAERRRVTVVVTNRRPERARLFVLRAGHAPALVGTVPPFSRATIDVTGSAPVGSRVRFAAVLDHGVQHVVTQEVTILRGGTVLIEIDAAAPGLSVASSRSGRSSRSHGTIT